MTPDALPTTSLPTLSPALTAPSHMAPQDARKAAQEFEAVFINQLLESMSAGLSTEGEFTGGPSEGVYRSLMNEQIAKSIAQRGGLGLADSVYHTILKLQEGSDHGQQPSASQPAR